MPSLHVGDECVCEFCGKTFVVKYPQNPNRFCSVHCGTRARSLTGQQNPSYRRVTNTCEHCGAVYSRTPSTIGRYCCKACADRGKKALTGATRYNYKGGPYLMRCEVCGEVRMVRHAMVKRFRACSKRCAGQLGVRAQQRSSSLEQTMLRHFVAAGLHPSPQYVVGPFMIDFAFNEGPLAVECDGVYWHGRPEQQKRDRQKDNYLRRHGWQVLRLTEQAIRTDPDQCVQQVIQTLRGQTSEHSADG